MSRLSSVFKPVLQRLGIARKPAAPTELGMTVPNEQRFCRRYAADRYTGAGAIGDLGCWMGATTISFSKGLRENAQLTPEGKKKRIHSYDLFRWHPSMDPNVRGTPLEGKFREGDSFLPEFEARTAPWAEHFTLHPGDINDHPWTGGPIEMLFVDAMKWPDTAQTILRNFYPHLIPGVSVVAQQDFAHFYTGWIHLIHYRLREYFDFDSEVPSSCTVAFKLKAAIPTALLEQDCRLETASKEELDAAFAYSASLVGPDKQEQIAAAHAMAYAHRGEIEAAERLARDFMWQNVSSYLYRKQRPEFIAVRRNVQQLRAASSAPTS